MMFNQLFLPAIRRELTHHRLRSGLTILGIALGVAVFLAIRLANHTALAFFEDSVNTVAGKATHEITDPINGYVSDSLLPALLPLQHAGIVYRPLREEVAVLPKVDAIPTRAVQVVGLDLLSDPTLSSAFLESGQADSVKAADIGNFLSVFQANHVLISTTLAKRYALKVGAQFSVIINDAANTLTVAGILPEKGLGRVYGGDVLVMDLSNMVALYDTDNAITQPETKLSRIQLVVPPEQTEWLEQKVFPRIQKQYQGRATLLLQAPQQRGRSVANMLKAYQINLTNLSIIAMLVGMFLIYNTMTLSVIRRRFDIGTLRCLGASKVQVFWLFGTEALTLGVLGSLLGILLGLFLSKYTVAAVSKTVESLYTGIAVSGMDWDLSVIFQGFLFGILATLAASFIPLLEATRIQPIEATRRYLEETAVKRPWKALFWSGLTCFIFAGISLQQPVWNGLPVFGFLSCLLWVAGLTCWLPYLLQTLLQYLLYCLDKITVLLVKTYPLQRIQMIVRLAVLSLQGALGRTAVTVASLMVGIAMMVSLAIMIGSFRETVQQWVNQSFQADLWLEPAVRTVNKRAGFFDPKTVTLIASLPGIVAMDRYIEREIPYQGTTTHLAAGDVSVYKRYGNLKFLDGERTQTVVQRMIQHQSTIVTESFALLFHVKKGDTIRLNTPSGTLSLSIEGVYYDYSSERGYVVIPRNLYEKAYRDHAISGLALYIKPNADATVLKEKLYSMLGANRLVNIRTNRDLKNEVLRIFDQTFAITNALHLIAIVVAVLGILNALVARVLENKRELGILKYLGTTQAQMLGLILSQAGILGVLGNLFGWLAGFVLAAVLIESINKQSFHWSIQWAIPWMFLGQSCLLVLLTALMSGLLPARLAIQTPAPEAVRDE